MKNLYTIVTLLFSASMLAQTHELTDHNGKKIEVNFIKIENNVLYYTTAASTEEKMSGIYVFAQLREKAKNEVKTMSEKIKVTGGEDFKKVIVLTSNQTTGLKKSGVITSFLGQTKGETKQSFMQQAENRLKQLAAKKGFPFIVITSSKSKNLKAITYTY